MASADRDVLIVDDDDIVAEAIADGVRLLGYTVCGIADNFEKALELTRTHRPRFAVVDVDLGGHDDGIEAAREMQKVGPIGIMFITGFPDKVRAAHVGHAWLEKPYRVLDLITGLEVVRAMSEHRPVTTPVPAALNLIS
jgi:two-component system, response regulator PdtaR